MQMQQKWLNGTAVFLIPPQGHRAVTICMRIHSNPPRTTSRLDMEGNPPPDAARVHALYTARLDSSYRLMRYRLEQRRVREAALRLAGVHVVSHAEGACLEELLSPDLCAHVLEHLDCPSICRLTRVARFYRELVSKVLIYIRVLSLPLPCAAICLLVSLSQTWAPF
jgi:hypothetical protein